MGSTARPRRSVGWQDARALFLEIDGASTEAQLARVGDKAELLTGRLDELSPSLGFDLWLWLGLKEDGELAMARDYRETLLDGHPQLAAPD